MSYGLKTSNSCYLRGYLKSLGRYNFALMIGLNCDFCEDLIADTLGTMSDIYTYLGVDPAFKPNVIRKYNVDFFPKNQFIHDLANLSRNYIHCFVAKIL